ncbi:MAG: GNAT family N-acetyltransferase [Proteobacteria bacterium]|nr:GNAT family N-acetyltransferase [Pseudomonadota bacterium]
MAAADTPAIEVRVAQPADGPGLVRAIAAIDRETDYLGTPGERLAWTDRPAAMLAELQQSDDGVYLIATAGDDVVGYAGALVGQYRSTRGVLSIPHIGVRAVQRRHGIAGRLLTALEAWARARDVHRIDLTVDQDNAAARALYRKHGYGEEGCMREAASGPAGWHSYVAMARLLDDAPPPMAPVHATRRPRADSLTIRFRPVAPGDAAALRVWEVELLSAPPRLLKLPDEVAPPERFRDELTAVLGNAANFLVAAVVDVDGAERVAGLLSVSAKPGVRLRHDLAVIINVLASYRGLGIGRRLFEIGEDWARAREAHRLSTAVHAANPSGLGFAAAVGFAPEVVLRRYARFAEGDADLIGLAKFPSAG